jgi:predicted aldo/keto reductase-like oxidoreductase
MSDDAQVEENLAIAGQAYPHSLTEAELALVGKAGRKYREIMKVGCTGCGYCEPCPMGVGIAASFDTYNHLHMFGNPKEAQIVYVVRLSGVITGSRGYASQCERCGDCVVKCPQGLEIPDLLEKVAAELEGDWVPQKEVMVRRFFTGSPSV